jgi:thiol-disulfide isomerase/thioredoxin
MKSEKLAKYVKTRNKKLSEYKFGPLQVFVKDPLPDGFDIQEVFDKLAQRLPGHYLRLVDIIYVGQFNIFKERQINAVYMDGAIYVTNEQSNSEDMLDDIIHETAHAIEEKYGQVIYKDGEIEEEFLSKRKSLKRILIDRGHQLGHLNFENVDFSVEFDKYMLEKVGYDNLRMLTVDVFLSPYSITSLREYFAIGFEEYYLGNKLDLREVCPYVYNKLYMLETNEMEIERYEF